MPYSDILKRAFQVVRNEPALWVLGIILAFFGGGGGGGFNFNTGGNFGGDGPNYDGPTPELPSWANPDNLLILGIVVGCFVLLWIVVAMVVQSAALAGLVHGAARAAEGEDVHWRDLWRAGFSRRGRRVLGLKLLVGIPMFVGILIGAGLLIAAAIPFFEAAFSNGEPGPGFVAGFLGGFLVLIPLILCLVLFTWVLELIGHYAVREVVLSDLGVLPAFRQGWRLFRNNLGPSILWGIILAVLGATLGFILGIAVFVLLLVMGLPLFLLLSSQAFPLELTVVSVILLALVIGLISSVLYGPLLAYVETVWTLVWEHLTGKHPTPSLQEEPLV